VDAVLPAIEESRHVLLHDRRVVAKSVFGGLHYEDQLERIAACDLHYETFLRRTDTKAASFTIRSSYSRPRRSAAPESRSFNSDLCAKERF